METNRKLSVRQKCAITRARQIASRLQKKHPEILNMYRNDKTLSEIVNELSLCDEYTLSQRVAISAVSAALRGCSNSTLGLNSLKGLLDTKEADELLKKHRQDYNKKAAKNGIGLYSLSSERRTEIGKIGGSKSGKKNLELYILSKPEIHKSGSKKGVIARGKVPWKEREITLNYCRLSEKEFTLMLYQSEKYQTWQRRHNIKKIKETVNEVYHNGKPVRTYEAIKQTMSKLKTRSS